MQCFIFRFALLSPLKTHDSQRRFLLRRNPRRLSSLFLSICLHDFTILSVNFFRQVPLSLMHIRPHPKDNTKWHDFQMSQYIFKSSRYPSTLIRVPGAVLVGLTLTRLCAGIITVPIRLEPTINQVNIRDFKMTLEILGHFLNTLNIFLYIFNI